MVKAQSSATVAAGDAIVIGSGFAGSVSASRLVEAGLRVTVLERGPWRSTVPVTAAGIERTKPLPQTGGLLYVLRTLHLPFGPKSSLRLNKDGLLEICVTKPVTVVCSSSVGGGSHVWAGLLTRAPLGFWDGRAKAVSSEMMKAHYDRVFRELKAAKPKDPDDVPNHPGHAWRNKQFFSPIADEEQPHMGFLFPERGANSQAVCDDNGILRAPIDYRQPHGAFGSPSGAKSTVDALYLLPAIRKGGLEVLDSHEVQQIGKVADGGYGVTVKDLRLNRTIVMTAPIVILAAGTMNTLRLLFESRRQGGLSGMPHLGKGFGTNGDCIARWVPRDEPELDSCPGTPVHGRIKIKGHEDTGYVILGGAEIPPVPSFMQKKERVAAGKCYQVIAMGQDSADGEVTYRSGRIDIVFDVRGSPIYKRIFQAYRELEAMSGWRMKFNEKKVLTAHPMGGCRIADDPTHGVVDGLGEVHGHKGLFVADASAFPQPVGVPPSLSIAAWASHVSEGIARRVTAKNGFF